jgi:hypothetical protein
MLGGYISLRRSWWGFVLKLNLSLGLIGLIIYFVDFQVLVDSIVNLNPWYLGVVFILIYVDRGLMAYKWNQLLRAVNIGVPFTLLFRTYLIAPMVGMLLPSTIGGDIFRVYTLSRHKADARAVLASIVMERVIGFVAMLALVTVSLGLAFYLLRDSWAYFKAFGVVILLGAVVAAGMIGVALGGFRKVADHLASRLANLPFVNKLHQIYLVYSEYRHHHCTLAIVYTWTFLEQMMPIVTSFLLVRAFHINVSFLELVTIIPLVILGMRLPITIHGLGVQEGLYVGLFGLVGVSAAEALLVSTAARVLEALCALPWAIHYIVKGREAALPEQLVNTVKPISAHE